MRYTVTPSQNAELYALGYGIGFIFGILIVLALVAAFYVLNSLSHRKALKALGYDKAWIAWIPYGVYFGCADAVSGKENNIRLFNQLEVPVLLFKLWWIVPVIFLFLPLNFWLESLVNLVLEVIFLGCTYAKMYARLENKSEKDTQVIGCVSGAVPIVAIVKFLMMK